MTSNEERREIARKLRDIKCVDLGDGLVCPSCDLGEALDFDWANDDYIFEATVDKLAELIDRPTCKNAKIYKDVFECSECHCSPELITEVCNEYGEPFSVPFMPTFCPACGAEVIE